MYVRIVSLLPVPYSSGGESAALRRREPRFESGYGGHLAIAQRIGRHCAKVEAEGSSPSRETSVGRRFAALMFCTRCAHNNAPVVNWLSSLVVNQQYGDRNPVGAPYY